MSQALSASPAVPEPAVMTTFLAIDFGLKRTGIAVGKRLLRTAQSVGTVRAEGDARFAHIEKHLKEWQPDALVIGVPYHPDGAAHEARVEVEEGDGAGRRCRGGRLVDHRRPQDAQRPL